MSPDTAELEGGEQGYEDEGPDSEPAAERAEPLVNTWFEPMPVLKVLLLGIPGGMLYCMYWGYRNWAIYRRAWGYSRTPFWREVWEATGYRVSPFWRSVMFTWYALCLFLAVQREAKDKGAGGVGSPILLHLLLSVLLLYRVTVAHTPLVRALCTPVWALVPVQWAINRLNRAVGKSIPLRVNAVELLCAAVGGALLFWRAR